MWDFYAIQLPELSLKRAALFVRVMVVDSQPFLALLLAQLRHEDWEIRLEGILRLFRIVLDVTSTAFVAEGRQWGLSVVDVFYYFFSAMWTDDKEEIRLAVDTWSQTLLPAHHEAIMRCWNETLSRAPISEKLKLINFLCQLRSHFPAWKVLAWETIIEALLESEFMARNGHLEDGAAAAHLSLYGLSSKEGDEAQTVSDPDSFLLRAALISLSLRMIADGITVELFSLLKLKHQLLLTFGYRDVSLVPSSNGQTFYVQFGELDCFPPVALPCIADLMLVLDSAQPCDISSSAMGGPDVDDETKHSLLIGSVFVDILVDLSSHLSELGSSPPLVLKNLLKTLIIAMQKHDFDSQPLRYLHSDLRKALRCALMMYSDEGHLSLELRQLALSACQVFITRWPDIMGPFIYEAIESVTKVMVSLHYEEHPEDSLVVQSRMFLEGLMTTFYGRGILNVLFKRVLSPDFFKVLNKVLGNKPTAIGQPNLKDALLYDTLSRAPNNEGESYQTVLDNLGTFVEIVHHSAYTIDMLEFVGLSFTNIAHKVSDWTVDTFDASSLLLMSATLIQYNKSHSRIFIPQVATVLHLLLGKCRLSSAALSHVLQVTAALYRKAEQTPNLIVVTFLESVSEILSSKGKSFSSTFPAALEVVISNVGLSCIARESLLRLAEDGFLYLHSYNAMSPWHQDFVSCQAVAKIVLRAAEESMGTLRHLENNPLGVRTWNAIVLAGLSVNGSQSPSLLLRYFHAFVLPYYTSLEPLQAISEHQGLGDVESNQISRAYIAIKLWLLVVLRLLGSGLGTSSEESTDIASLHQCRMVWNELWPPFEAVVINLLHVHGAANSLLLASSSVADLFLFLHQTRIIISLETSSQVALLTQLQANSRLESKISRVLRSLTEPPPNNPIGYYVSQIAAEISAEEKLEAARLQESMKPIWDRGRRVVS
ncbi:uncharacterized protein PHACADRAFT_256290 [Phanerochaete carnosa HHB-10118-sp]|uniref:Uncharacterized protein n=1 Tax=Phanerochaete carnosa (strain HHB-10118-sp) TaxID=650164 RepID=K5UZH5_PHACS|nr:uncharacterized protein PHACADRAFT_256290 [Phanerochaete carnosa HHB-10118-sp]EKM55576.1 hypothetical protein PHACADRAFT_256290 [Phanerochaete carnosa HHB-10118-sp]